MDNPTIRPSPDHYWDFETLSWKVYDRPPSLSQKIADSLENAEYEYAAAVNAYHEVSAEGNDGFCEHNDVSYWKGRRDALKQLIL